MTTPSQIGQIEALLLASPTPVSIEKLKRYLSDDVEEIIKELADFWGPRGMNVKIREGFISFIPSEAVLKALSSNDSRKGRKLTDAAIETLCFISMHQPVTTKDIEAGRNLALFKGVLDSLLDAGFIRTSIRKTDAGRAVAYVTTDTFLDHFGLSSLGDLPTRDELMEIVSSTPDQTEKEVPQPQVDVALGFETSNLFPINDET